jgi:transcriptional regulator with XRE-family HTH domain
VPRRRRRAPISIALGHAIRLAREDRGWSQETVAGEAGLHPTYVGDVERGERNITVLSLCKIADGLEVPASRLLEVTEGLMRDPG